jgi:hypothetical protein
MPHCIACQGYFSDDISDLMTHMNYKCDRVVRCDGCNTFYHISMLSPKFYLQSDREFQSWALCYLCDFENDVD